MDALSDSDRDDLLDRIVRLLEQQDNIGKWEEQFLQSIECQVLDHVPLSHLQIQKLSDLEIQLGIRLEER